MLGQASSECGSAACEKHAKTIVYVGLNLLKISITVNLDRSFFLLRLKTVAQAMHILLSPSLTLSLCLYIHMNMFISLSASLSLYACHSLFACPSQTPFHTFAFLKLSAASCCSYPPYGEGLLSNQLISINSC